MAICLDTPKSTQSALEEAVPGGEGEDTDSLAVKSIGKLGAVTPHAQFEEREQETESGQAGLRWQVRKYCQ